MKSKLSREEAEKEIENFFKNIKSKSPKEIKKIKRLAMSKNIPLREKRKLFCGKCFTAFSGKEKVQIKNKFKNIFCEGCGNLARWRLA